MARERIEELRKLVEASRNIGIAANQMREIAWPKLDRTDEFEPFHVASMTIFKNLADLNAYLKDEFEEMKRELDEEIEEKKLELERLRSYKE